MVITEKRNAVITVIVTYTVEPEYAADFEKVFLESAAVIARQHGFVCAGYRKNTTGTRLIHRITWESLDHHKACLNNPEVARASAGVVAYLESGRAEMNVTVYTDSGV